MSLPQSMDRLESFTGARVAGERDGSCPVALCLTLATVIGLASGGLWAQEQQQETGAEPEPSLTQEETIYVKEKNEAIATRGEIATKLDLSLQLTPASVSVVTAPVIREQAGTTLNDAMENVSGANVQTTSGVHDLFVLRGYDSLSAGLILTDGAPEPEATFYQLYNVERVEVLKGPGTYLYGGNPLAGTVNLVSKKPGRFPLLDTTLQVGSFDTLRYSLDYNLGRGDEPISFRLNGLYDESSHYRNDLDSRSVGVNPALAWWISSGSVLRASVELLRNDFTPDGGIPVAAGGVLDVPRRTTYQSPFDFSDQDLERVRLVYEGNLGSRWQLRDRLYYTSLDWLSDGTVLAGVFPSPVGDLLFRTLVRLDNNQAILGNQFELVRDGERHGLLLGVEATRSSDEFLIRIGMLPPMDPFDPVETATEPPPEIPSFRQQGDAESTVVAPYALDRISLGDRLQLVVGARFDSLDYEDRATATSRDADELSPMLGLSYSPSRAVTLYGNLTHGFAPPPSRVIGDREPEESDQVELGLKTSLRRSLMLNAAVYRLDRKNVAIFDDLGATAQQGSQRSQGLELELLGTVGSGLRYQVAYAYTDAELTEFNELVQVGIFPPAFLVVDRSGNSATFAPEHTLNAWLAKQWQSGLGVAGGLRYLSEQFIGEDNAFAIEDALTFSAMLAYNLRRWRLSVNLENLTDEEYETRGFGTTSVIPGDPRSVTVGIGYRR